MGVSIRALHALLVECNGTCALAMAQPPIWPEHLLCRTDRPAQDRVCSMPQSQSYSPGPPVRYMLQPVMHLGYNPSWSCSHTRSMSGRTWRAVVRLAGLVTSPETMSSWELGASPHGFAAPAYFLGSRTTARTVLPVASRRLTHSADRRGRKIETAWEWVHAPSWVLQDGTEATAGCQQALDRLCRQKGLELRRPGSGCICRDGFCKKALRRLLAACRHTVYTLEAASEEQNELNCRQIIRPGWC